MRPSRNRICAAACLALTGVLPACSCEEPAKIKRIAEEYRVVEGNPNVDNGQPRVDRDTPKPPQFKLNVPHQCDFFQQNAVRKVDILWVVDNSFSMRSSQANLAGEFPKFIESLLKLRPPVDFHIGVTSTDTDNERLVYDSTRDAPLPPDDRGTRGELHPFNLGTGGAGRYLACASNGTCNVTATRVAEAFAQMSKVGTAGSSAERGLLASYLALTRGDNTRAEDAASTDLAKQAPFIRADAALFLVFVSDEDDSSCGPFVPLNVEGRPSSGEPCLADPGCRCDASRLTSGSVQYFVRFLESYKGFGNKDLVAVGAVACLDKKQVPAQSGETTFVHLGCPDTGSGASAYYGERYIQVAAQTGGTAISIRGSFANALQSLGFAVSGLRKDFRLTRGPLTESLEVFVSDAGSARCTSDAQCKAGERCRTGTCATPKPMVAKSLQACSTSSDPKQRPAVEYCKCDANAFRNILRFNEEGQPAAQATIEVCYDVNTSFSQVCQ